MDPAVIGAAENRYAILDKLAAGGMAELFLARTESAAGVERYVVLKRVLSHRADDITFVNMFLDEARLAAQLQHPNIAQVFDTGKLGDTYFFTMEYVHGETVRDLMSRCFAAEKMVPISCALTVVAAAAAGLAHAHERIGSDGKPLGIVHRDVSPSNIMLTYEGNVKLVDFGVAKATRRTVETQSGTVKGKVGYMSPEQCKGGDVDPRSDLFSLGIVLWELLVGDRLYKRATEFETMEAIVNEIAQAPSTRRPEVPPAVDMLVKKLLEKAPGDRYQSAHEVVEAIEHVALETGFPLSVSALRRLVLDLFGHRPEPWLGKQGGGETSAGHQAIRSTGQMLEEIRADRLLAMRSRSDDDSAPFDDERPRRKRWPLAAGMVVLAGGAIGLSFAFGRGSDQPPVDPDQPPADPTHAATVADAAPRPAPDATLAVDAAVVPSIVDARVPLSPSQALALALRENRYADAVASCAADKQLAKDNPTACTLAACHEGAQQAARTWAKRIARDERATTADACRALGVALDRRRITSVPTGNPPDTKNPKDEKCADPMACRK